MAPPLLARDVEHPVQADDEGDGPDIGNPGDVDHRVSHAGPEELDGAPGGGLVRDTRHVGDEDQDREG